MCMMDHLAFESRLFCGLASENAPLRCRRILRPTHLLRSSSSRLSSPSREESEIPQQVESPRRSWMCPSGPSLSSSSSPAQRAWRGWRDVLCHPCSWRPIVSQSGWDLALSLFRAHKVCTRSSLSCTGSQHALFLHTIWKEAMHPSHCRSKLDRNRPSEKRSILSILSFNSGYVSRGRLASVSLRAKITYTDCIRCDVSWIIDDKLIIRKIRLIVWLSSWNSASSDDRTNDFSLQFLNLISLRSDILFCYCRYGRQSNLTSMQLRRENHAVNSGSSVNEDYVSTMTSPYSWLWRRDHSDE